jgi:bacillithiol biosynthesis cysteine-adding enzyme BshC
MSYRATNLSYRKTGFFSRIITDYLRDDESLRPYYAHSVSMEGVRSAIHARQEFKTNRKLLVDELVKQYQKLQPAIQVMNNIEKLGSENTFSITTAHQPAIFTGTLFFIYKILHTIRLAENLSKELPQFQFVPVYYMGSEDADLDELGNIYLDQEKINWDTKQRGAVGRMNTKGLEKIIGRIAGEYAGYPFGQELVGLLKECYLDSADVQTATLRLIDQLFGQYGLVVLIPDNADFKRQMLPVFEDDLLNQRSSTIVEATIESFPEVYKVQAKPREINLFYLKDDIRELIEYKDEKFTVRHTAIQFSKKEILDELATYPERFSPNVILRGLFQSTLLPDIIFIGGGGETAYWLELKELFKRYSVPYPMLVIRNSFLIIEKKWKKKMENAGMSVFDLFKKEDEILNDRVKKESANQLSLQKEIAVAENYYANLKKIAAPVDGTMEQHVEAMQAKALKQIREFEKKLLRNEKRKFDDINRQIHHIKSELFPLNNLQERIENFIPYYVKGGKGFIEDLYKHSLGLEQEFVVLEENE